jgi:hypothetical protein
LPSGKAQFDFSPSEPSNFDFTEKKYDLKRVMPSTLIEKANCIRISNSNPKNTSNVEHMTELINRITDNDSTQNGGYTVEH